MRLKTNLSFRTICLIDLLKKELLKETELSFTNGAVVNKAFDNLPDSLLKKVDWLKISDSEEKIISKLTDKLPLNINISNLDNLSTTLSLTNENSLRIIDWQIMFKNIYNSARVKKSYVIKNILICYFLQRENKLEHFLLTE